MSNVQRVQLTDELAKAGARAETNEAFALLNAAADFERREQRPMTQEEALVTIREVAAGIEALGGWMIKRLRPW